MNEQDKQINETKLNGLITEYQSLVKQFSEFQWKIVRKRKEIEEVCNVLGIELKEEKLDINEHK